MKLELPQDMAVRFDYIAIEGSHIVSHIKNAGIIILIHKL